MSSRGSEISYNPSESMLLWVVIGGNGLIRLRFSRVFHLAVRWLKHLFLRAGTLLLDQPRLGMVSTFVIHENMVVGVEVMRTIDGVANAGRCFHPGQL
jgi:hypothetical protein